MTSEKTALLIRQLLEKRDEIDQELRKLVFKPAPSTTKRGRFRTYDKQRVLYDIVSGEFSAKEIAKRHGITRDMVYTLKHVAKKKNIIRDPAVKVDDLDSTF